MVEGDSVIRRRYGQKNAPILLANLFQGSRSTLSCVSFPSVFAFQAGMWGIPISALLNSPTVSARLLYSLTIPTIGPAEVSNNSCQESVSAWLLCHRFFDTQSSPDLLSSSAPVTLH